MKEYMMQMADDIYQTRMDEGKPISYDAAMACATYRINKECQDHVEGRTHGKQ